MITKFLAAGLLVLVGNALAGCSSGSSDADPTQSAETAIDAGLSDEVDPDLLDDMESLWIFSTATKQNEVCGASIGGQNVDAGVVDLFTLNDPTVWGSLDDVRLAVERILLAECGEVTPLSDASSADAGAIAQQEWERTVEAIGGVDEVCESWRANNFDQSVMFSAGPSAIERAGYAPEDGKVFEFVASYDLLIRANCEG